MPAGRKPTGINGRNGGRANDGGLDVGKPAEQHAGRTRWVHPIRGVERKANRIADMKNPPRCSPGGAIIQHSSKLPARRLSEFQPADADSQVASASRRICRIASATFAGSASGGRVLAVRWLRASHRCVGKQHRLKSEHALDGALVTGCRFVRELLYGGFLLGDPAALTILVDGDLFVHRTEPDARQGT